MINKTNIYINCIIFYGYLLFFNLKKSIFINQSLNKKSFFYNKNKNNIISFNK